MSLLNRHLRNSFKVHYYLQRRYQQTQTKVKLPPLSVAPIFRNVQNFADKIALRDNIAPYTYGNLFVSANELSKEISRLVGGKTNERVLFLCPNDANYVVTLWAIWISGQIAVPLSPLHPQNILLYYTNDTKSKLLITTSEYANVMQRVAKNTHSKLHVLDDKLKLNTTEKFARAQSDFEAGQPPEFYEDNNAMILYTSGTTGSPKGVVLSHKNLLCQTTTLLDAWKWTQNDVLLHTLPLHHIHGIVNALLCPLFIGAKTIMLEKFDANAVWSYLLGVNASPDDRKISVYMGVPTIYSKLIDEYEKVFHNDPKMIEYIKNTLKTKIRLMISGSAPLPVPIYERWLKLSGHRLLERYGMTETGMSLSNVYESDREPGYVGVPLPGVSVQIGDKQEDSDQYKTILECTNNNGHISVKNQHSEQNKNPTGELLVKGEGVFKEYYNRPDATKNEFTSSGWFKTGDMVEYSLEKKKFKTLGRKSVDIIKSGGYKISALEVETHLISHPHIKECVVVGIPDKEWGERVVAIVVLKKDKQLTIEELSEWATNKMAKYCIPTVLTPISRLPKNAMGKVNKKELIKTLFN